MSAIGKVYLTTDHTRFRILETSYGVITAIRKNEYADGDTYPFLVDYKTPEGVVGTQPATNSGVTRLFTIINK